MDKSIVKKEFNSRFEGEGTTFASPGRINIIGEHTDYNGGFVLPGAVDMGMMAELRFNSGPVVRAYAIDLDSYCEFGLEESDLPEQSWARYIFGVCREMIKRGHQIKPFDTVFTGNVPLGAGMSSSAALESTYAFALNDMLDLGIEKMELAKIGQATEHNYVGVKCGIMDQFASIHGKAGNLMRLDCKSGEFEYIPFSPEEHGYSVVLVDTCVKHELVGSPYNRRRESCERAVEAIKVLHPEVEFLRDAKPEWLEEVIGKITMEDYFRARYAIEEVDRLLVACEHLQKGDYETLGQKMYGTHNGMSLLYEVSCQELDYVVEQAKLCGVSGARVMGGGFGGCVITVVKSSLKENFIATIKKNYKEKFDIDCKIYPVIISDGARKL